MAVTADFVMLAFHFGKGSSANHRTGATHNAMLMGMANASTEP